MAVIETEGLFKGKRLRRCSPMARWYWPYLFLLSNGFARIELDYECIADEFGSFRGAAPTVEDIAQAFVQYREHHLIFVYVVNGQEWGQWDTRRSLLKEYKTAGDKSSPKPPECEYRHWLIEQHGEEWPAFHWNGCANSETLEQNLTKSQPNVPQESALGVGGGVGVGGGIGGGIGTGVDEGNYQGRGKNPDPVTPEEQLQRFGGHEWCVKTVKAHPLWKNPDAVDVPATVSNAYIEAVEVEAKRFNGNLELAAQDILARTLAFARKVKAGTEKAFGTVVGYFKGAIYNNYQPEIEDAGAKPKAAIREMTVEEELALIEANEQKREERRKKALEAPIDPTIDARRESVRAGMEKVLADINKRAVGL